MMQSDISETATDNDVSSNTSDETLNQALQRISNILQRLKGVATAYLAPENSWLSPLKNVLSLLTPRGHLNKAIATYICDAQGYSQLLNSERSFADENAEEKLYRHFFFCLYLSRVYY